MNWWEFENFYEQKTNKNIERGDIVWTPVLYLDSTRQVLNMERDSVDSDTHTGGKFCIEKLDFNKHFNHRAVKLPVYNLGIRYNEEMLLYKSKMRPCIVLHVENETIQKPTDNDNAVPGLNKQCVFLLPLYGFEKDSSGILKYSPIMQKRITCLQYGKLFFFPKDSDRFSQISKNSFGRFDMCFNVPMSYLCPTQRRVSDLYMNLLNLYISSYFGMPITDEFFKESKDLLQLAQGQYEE